MDADRELWEKGDFTLPPALFADQNRSLDGGAEIVATFLLVNVTRSYP